MTYHAVPPNPIEVGVSVGVKLSISGFHSTRLKNTLLVRFLMAQQTHLRDYYSIALNNNYYFGQGHCIQEKTRTAQKSICTSCVDRNRCSTSFLCRFLFYMKGLIANVRISIRNKADRGLSTLPYLPAIYSNASC